MVIRKKLKNNIRVVMEPMDHFVSVSIGVWVEVGSVNENPQNNGIAHVVEHMLFKGTYNRTAREIADEMTAIGDQVDAYTSKECTCYYTKTLKEYAYSALDIMADMIKNSKIDKDDLTKEKRIILDEIDMYEDDADELVHELLQKEVWGSHPLGYIISGEKDVVSSFTVEDVCSFMEKYYTGNHILISVAGQFEPEQVMKDIEKLFGDIPAGETAETLTSPIYTTSILCRHKDIEQMHLDLAFDSIPYEHEDKYVMGVADRILGGNVNSRLFQEVREEKGLTYSIYSYTSSFRQCGLFQIYAAMAPEQTAVVLDAILESLDKLRKGQVSEKELMLTKRAIRTELLMAKESTHDRMESNARAWIYKERNESIEETVACVEAVSAEDIKRFVNQYLVNDKISASLIGNFSAVNIEDINEIFKKRGIFLRCGLVA